MKLLSERGNIAYSKMTCDRCACVGREPDVYMCAGVLEPFVLCRDCVFEWSSSMRDSESAVEYTMLEQGIHAAGQRGEDVDADDVERLMKSRQEVAKEIMLWVKSGV